MESPTVRAGSLVRSSARPLVMGIVNVTPDSFSDGGLHASTDAAVEHGLRLIAEGADLIDIGGESTRPRGRAYGQGAAPVDVQVELGRVVPVIRELARQTAVPISVDTRRAEVARASIAAGASVVNDVSGLLHDPSLAGVVARSDASLCLMHTPVDIESLAHERDDPDPVGTLLSGLRDALERASAVPRDRLWVDPGFGFGKSPTFNLWILRHLDVLREFGLPVLVGASRKASLGWAAGPPGHPLPVQERLAASVGAALLAAESGAQVVRVHDVSETVQSLRVWWACREVSDA